MHVFVVTAGSEKLTTFQCNQILPDFSELTHLMTEHR